MLSFKKKNKEETNLFIAQIIEEYGYYLSVPPTDPKSPHLIGSKYNGGPVVGLIYNEHSVKDSASWNGIAKRIHDLTYEYIDECLIVVLTSNRISRDFKSFINNAIEEYISSGLEKKRFEKRAKIRFFSLLDLWKVVRNSPNWMDDAQKNGFVIESNGLASKEFLAEPYTSRKYKIRESLLSLKKELERKYDDYTRSTEFYYQKAREVFLKLQNYDKKDTPFYKGEGQTKAVNDPENAYYSFVQLKEYWDKYSKGQKLSPSAFAFYLEEEEDEYSLHDLFILINRFIAYIYNDTWNQAEFNEYKPPRVLLNNSVEILPEHSIGGFLDYAANGFYLGERSKRRMHYAIEYLQDPQNLFITFPKYHEERISKIFLGGIYEGKDFHENLKKFFDSLNFSINSEENRTAFYTRVLYDRKVRTLWEMRTIVEEEDEDVAGDDYDAEREREELNNSREKIPFHLDQVVKEDKLGRKPIAKAFARLIKEDIFTKELSHSFMVHLQGEWGSGKSSFMNFIEEELNQGKTQWIVINYNAWQNQHIEPPWWTLIDQVYRQSKQSLKRGDRFIFWIRERWRRAIWYKGWQKAMSLFLTLLLVLLLIRFAQPILTFATSGDLSHNDTGITLEVITKLIISLASMVGIIFSFSQFISAPLFVNTSRQAESFVKRATDPMTRIKDHFGRLVNNIVSKEKRELLIFIDDIDRCNREFIVELLEGIQTLFKEKRVLYIVAGDKQWITKSFANTYQEFSVEKEGGNDRLGELFLEKAFQLSFRMPEVSESAKWEFWNHIIGEKKEEQKQSFQELNAEKQQEVRQVISTSTEDIASSEFMNRMEQDFNLRSDDVSDLVIEEKISDQEELKHLLNDFHSYINTNPRAIIRLANNYSMIRSTLIAERKDISTRHVFRWLVIEDLIPKVRTQIYTFGEFKELEEFIEKNAANDTVRKNCMKLLKGGEEEFDGALTLEEIHKIIGR